MRLITVFLILVFAVALFSCTSTQKGAVIGGGAGAGLGAIIGHQSGHTGEGAAIGAAVGGISGAIIGEKMDKKFCPVCGKRYTAGEEFCTEDGTKLELIK
ncbi:MAG: glycine zipper 2TM domain-containing protein [Candidatus Omnitrophica bacterium]|nr:glycine zipper 2TM domain-containing protein [Candidatus Omnitrophota bacterium]